MKKQAVKGPFTRNLKKDEILFLADQKDYDLFIVHTGKLMVCVSKGSQISPIAYIGPGEYIGELSFFDCRPRSATVICVEDASLIQIPIEEREKQFPSWLLTLVISLTLKIRKADELIRQKGIRKKKVQGIRPLSMEDQRYFYKIIKQQDEPAMTG